MSVGRKISVQIPWPPDMDLSKCVEWWAKTEKVLDEVVTEMIDQAVEEAVAEAIAKERDRIREILG